MSSTPNPSSGLNEEEDEDYDAYHDETFRRPVTTASVANLPPNATPAAAVRVGSPSGSAAPRVEMMTALQKYLSGLSTSELAVVCVQLGLDSEVPPSVAVDSDRFEDTKKPAGKDVSLPAGKDTSLPKRTTLSHTPDSTIVSKIEKEATWSSRVVQGQRRQKKLLEGELGPIDEHARDWNGEFQQLVQILCRDESILDEEKTFGQLAGLARDFQFAACTIGRLIISELYLSTKTVKPITVGVAGGIKYVCQNIVFKFAVDANKLYGSDEQACKAAGHELRGLSQVYRSVSSIDGLHVPLCCLIDYRGFRLIAVARLPISKATIVYGSDDGGRNIYNESSLLNKKMEKVAQILNLESHQVRDKNQRVRVVHGPFDMEGHRGLDGRFYLLDFHRTFCPQPPSPTTETKWKNTAAGAGKNKHLYQLLRPELIRKSPVPLSSDAYSSVSVNNKVSAARVEKCFDDLKSRIIPKFAQELEYWQLGSEQHQSLTSYVHQAGINIRHLGLVRRRVVSPQWRGVLLAEMIARVMKNSLRARFRETMKKTRYISKEPFRNETLDFVNLGELLCLCFCVERLLCASCDSIRSVCPFSLPHLFQLPHFSFMLY